MKSQTLYIVLIVGVIAAINLILLLKISQTAPSPANTRHNSSSQELLRVDSLILRDWKSSRIVIPDFRKPTVVFLFSKNNCQNCVETAVDFLTEVSRKSWDVLVAVSDVDRSEDKQIYRAKFRRAPPFYDLLKLRLDEQRQIPLPVFIVMSEKREVLFWRAISPFAEKADEYLFWERMRLVFGLR